ncbi:hypothetical protein [Acetitomaculum ruminis]|uniref:hypothetical protein n=1 Tax=Acetitomaculum ruminis TaxID=2382 RepID=UPI000B8365AB|nr:hypothetical protein [Acetitomaculum ruminis]
MSSEAKNQTYHTYYSSTKKTCKITCNYTDVSYIFTPAGRIEIARSDAFQQFKWNYKKGVYAGKGGYGSADNSF